MDNAATVRAVYEAFSRGDIPFVLGLVAADADWEIWPDNRAQQAGVPWMQARRGPSGAAEFFGVVSQLGFHRFEVTAILDGGSHVGGMVSIDFTYKPTGKRFTDEEIHVFVFNDEGKICGFRHYFDTAKHIEAASA